MKTHRAKGNMDWAKEVEFRRLGLKYAIGELLSVQIIKFELSVIQAVFRDT